MIQYVKGDLFRSPAQTLVNTVNTVGVMGKGIALTFKKLYPDMFAAYQRACEEKRFEIGYLFSWRTPAKLIVNFPTKKSWRLPSQPAFIEAGLKTFVKNFQEMGVRSVAFPPLGCGNGELDFASQVQPLMEQYLSDLPIPVFVYAPLARIEAPEHRSIEEVRKWLRQEPRSLGFDEFWQDLKEVLAHKHVFRTLAQQTRVEAQFLVEPDRIRVKASEKSYTFSADEVTELWREIRDHMIVTTRSFPSREKQLSYLFPILAELEYVEAITVADTLGQLSSSPTFGLRLLPVEQPQIQRELVSA